MTPSVMNLTKISETQTKITLGWTPIPGCVGYRFQSATTAPKWSNTWDASRDRVTFAKAAWYKVEALGVAGAGEYPSAPPPPPPPPTGIAPPEPPRQGYTVPATAVSVSTLAQLQAALSGSASAIILENGNYDSAAPLNANGKSLYARTFGQAHIRTGINLNGGALYGVKVTISAARQLAANSGAVTTWSSNARLTDVEIDGGNVAWYGLAGYAPHGLILERVVVRNVLSDGLRISDNQETSTAVIQRITDVLVDGARGAPIPAGTGESGLWIGHPVAEPVERVEIHRAGWMGLWTGNNCNDVTISHLRISDIGPRLNVCYYSEHKTRRITLRNFHFTGPYGFTAEWYGESGTPGLTDATFEDGLIEDDGSAGCGIGFYFDERAATGQVAMRRIIFRGQRWAAVSNFKPDAGMTLVRDGLVYEMQPGAVELRSEHIYGCPKT